MQESTEPAGSAEQPEQLEQPEPPAPSTGWRWGLDDEDSPVVLEHPPGLEAVANAFEWFFLGFPQDKETVRSVLVEWRKSLERNGPNYSLSTNSAGGIRNGDTVEVSSFWNHFEPIVISNALFEEVVSAYQDFAEHDDRFP